MTRQRRHRFNTAAHGDETPILSFASLVGLIVVFVVLLLFWIAMVWGATSRCLPFYEHWHSSVSGNWPLFASFTLVFFLVLVWIAVLWSDSSPAQKSARFVLCLSFITVLIAAWVLVQIHRQADFEHKTRQGYYEGLIVKPPVWFFRRSESECATMRRFAGRWRVVDRELGTRGFDLPFELIELEPRGTYLAYRRGAREPLKGRWNPPYTPRVGESERWRDAWFRFDDGISDWDFLPQDDTLVLETPDYFRDRERSRIVLESMDVGERLE